MNYPELRRQQQEVFNALPLKFAFGREQFAEMMASWGLSVEDTDKIYSYGAGAFALRSDAQRIREMSDRLAQEMDAAMQDDEFLTGAIEYELANHEYIITWDASDTMDELGLSLDDERVNRCFEAAKARYLASMEDM